MLAIYLGLGIPGAGFAGETPVHQATPASYKRRFRNHLQR